MEYTVELKHLHDERMAVETMKMMINILQNTPHLKIPSDWIKELLELLGNINRHRAVEIPK